MLLLPLKANLALARVPVITYAVMILCVLIYVAQWDRETAIERSADEFCETQAQWHEPDSVRGILLDTDAGCGFWLSIIHFQPSKGWAMEAIADDLHEIYPEVDPVELATAVKELYGRFAMEAPASLDALLMYDPKVPNPWRMVTSSLSHADYLHLFGNMLFFFAFAGSVEIALGNGRRYVAVLLALAVITSLAYSLTMVGSPYRNPSLGLSGVVTGMIGLFAWLMPWARIRTLVFIFFYISIWLIPAWVLALWFIGWDIANMMRMGTGSGINYVAHVSGGIGGYLIGRYWFRQLKEEIAPLVADEIEHRRADRADTLGIMDSRRVSTDTTESMAWNREQALGLDRLLQRVHALANTHQPGAATAMLIDELPAFGDGLELHAQVMERLFLWPPNRTTLDFARIYIHRLLTVGKDRVALDICEQALGHSPMFRLADPQEALRLADFAEGGGRHDLALALVRDFEARYEGQGDSVRAGFMEARMLWAQTRDRAAARARLQLLLARRDHVMHPEILRFARLL